MDKQVIGIILILAVILGISKSKKTTTGTVTVDPLINYNLFLEWYAKNIGDFLPNGTIEFKDEYYDYWYTKIYKGGK
jgi:hypothetical protein